MVLEISDEIVAYHPDTLERLPVRVEDVLTRCRAHGDRRAEAIVRALPAHDGWLNAQQVDRLLIRVHCEMQRLSEELQHGRRVGELLRPLLDVLGPRLQVIDIGCGMGYVIRWLASRAGLGPEVELIGVDYNRALVDEASRLAEMERLRCRFVVGNAFALKNPGGGSVPQLFLSTGVLHHFQGAGLEPFFGSHQTASAAGFVHFDFQPSPLAAFGSWLFHVVRTREPLSLHDGVVSARRVHSGQVLLAAARAGAPRFQSQLYSTRLWKLPIQRVFLTLIGLPPEVWPNFELALGPRRSRLEAS